MNKNIFYFDLSFKPNVDIIGITVSKWKQHDFETILISNDVVIIQDVTRKVSGSLEREYSMGVNYYFCFRRTNIPHAAHNYGPGKSKYAIDYYRQTYCFPEKLSYARNVGMIWSRSNALIKIFQLELYVVCWLFTRDKLIQTSGEASRITNKNQQRSNY